jgi:hypothetical protein
MYFDDVEAVYAYRSRYLSNYHAAQDNASSLDGDISRLNDAAQRIKNLEPKADAIKSGVGSYDPSAQWQGKTFQNFSGLKDCVKNYAFDLGSDLDSIHDQIIDRRTKLEEQQNSYLGPFKCVGDVLDELQGWIAKLS